MRLLIVSLLGAIASVCGAGHGIQPPSVAQHQRLANRSPAGFSSSLTERNLTAVEEAGDIASVLGKRAFKNAHCTYYRAGLGACGWTNSSGQHIVALNRFQFESNKGWPAPQCGKWIKICYKGKCTSAEVVDLCPDAQCNYGALDLSESLFVFLAGSTGPGIIYTEWEWADGSSSTPKPTSTSTKPKPTSTKTTTTKTTSKYTPPPEPETSTTKSHSSEAHVAPTSTKTTHSSSSTSTSTSSSSTPTPTPDEPTIDNTASMLQALLGMSYLLQGASLEVHAA